MSGQFKLIGCGFKKLGIALEVAEFGKVFNKPILSGKSSFRMCQVH